MNYELKSFQIKYSKDFNTDHTMSAITLEGLKQELMLVSSLPIAGMHAKVAIAVGISNDYSRKIRNTDYLKIDSKENRELLKNMIKNYRQQIGVFMKDADEKGLKGNKEKVAD